MAVVVKERKCRQCGAGFDGGPRAWYCPNCRIERKKEADKRFRNKRRADRPLGSTDRCVRCGAEYIVNSARQKYCPACAREAVREVDRSASRAWNQEHKETHYPAKNEARKKYRAENPEIFRKKEREYWAKRKGKKIKKTNATGKRDTPEE